MSAVNDKVKQIVAQQFGIEASKISDNASFADDLEADSLDRVELIMALEEAFDIQIPDGDVEKITTVDGVINYIEKNAKITKQ